MINNNQSKNNSIRINTHLINILYLLKQNFDQSIGNVNNLLTLILPQPSNNLMHQLKELSNKISYSLNAFKDELEYNLELYQDTLDELQEKFT